MYALTAAHRTLQFNSIVKVVNKRNGRSVIVRINDRGPFAKNRIIDLSKKAAQEINMIQSGFTEVDLYLLNNTKMPENIKKSHFTVQVGSYLKRSDARKLLERVFNSRIVEATMNGTKYYRVYSGKFSTSREAKKLKNELTKKGFDCFVKQIEN